MTIVLSFDDGPVSADIAFPETLAETGVLLEPIERILDVLAQREIQAMFYIEGPGSPEAARALHDVFGEGLLAIHEAGHILGYHAFDHNPRIWFWPIGPREEIHARMNTDLDRLEAFLDDVLPSVGVLRQDVFTGVFRQPFGGGGILSRLDALMVVSERGWTYHGYMINSIDWTDDADADAWLVDRLPVQTEADHVELVLQRLRAGADENRDRSIVDVLLHVNSFTATHLDEWIDELASAFARTTGRAVRFAVPDCYLANNDLKVETFPFVLLLSQNE